MNTKASGPRPAVALRSATGRDYAEWFRLLDDWGAAGRSYRDIADWLTQVEGMSEWWAQKVIVEYEQDRGLRQPGARPDGTFTGGTSKTVAAAVERVYEAFVDPAIRGRWLSGIELHQRTSRSMRSVRYDTPDGSRLNVTFEAKGDGKCQVAVEHERLPDTAAADRAKAEWRQRLNKLKTLLEG